MIKLLWVCDILNKIYFRIVESKSNDYPVGVYVEGYFGWRNYTISNKDMPDTLGFGGTRILPGFGNLPLSLGLGVLGMPG